MISEEKYKIKDYSMSTKFLNAISDSLGKNLKRENYSKKDFTFINACNYFLKCASYNINGKYYESAFWALTAIMDAIGKKKYPNKRSHARFKQVILDYFEEEKLIPSFIFWKIEISKTGSKIYTRDYSPKEIKEIKKTILKYIDLIYKEYRCNTIHEAKLIPFHSKVISSLGSANSLPDIIRIQDFWRLTLEILDHYTLKVKLKEEGYQK